MNRNFSDLMDAILNGKSIFLCKIGSGFNKFYEEVEFIKQTNSGALSFKTKSGSRFQVKDEFGSYKLCGKASKCFFKFNEVDSDYMENIIL